MTSLPLAQAVDGLMAATALVHDCALVTRNINDVASTGVRLLDPFARESQTGNSAQIEYGHFASSIRALLQGEVSLLRRSAVGRPYSS